MKITKRQLKRLIREAGRDLNDPQFGEASRMAADMLTEALEEYIGSLGGAGMSLDGIETMINSAVGKALDVAVRDGVVEMWPKR